MLRKLHHRLIKTIIRHKNQDIFKEDLYGEMGLRKSATPSEIKRAFVQLTKQYHPDANKAPSAKERYRKINEAYQVLSNATRKSEYDNFQKNLEAFEEEPEMYDFTENSEFEGFFYDDYEGDGSGTGNDFNTKFRDYNDFFKFPESAYKQEKAIRGKNILLDIPITFPEAVNGVMKQISFMKRDVCPECEGSRSKPGSVPIKCRKCDATGTLTLNKDGTQIHLQCRPCEGKGFIIQEKCDYCDGKGVSTEEQFEDVWIDRGVKDREIIALKGKGNKGDHGGVRGDLILQIRLVEDQRYQIDGSDIFVERDVTISEAMLGFESQIETLDGPRKLTVKAGTKDRTIIKFPGLGLILDPTADDEEKGDFYVIIRIVFDKNMSREQREIWEKIKMMESQGV